MTQTHHDLRLNAETSPDCLLTIDLPTIDLPTIDLPTMALLTMKGNKSPTLSQRQGRTLIRPGKVRYLKSRNLVNIWVRFNQRSVPSNLG